MKTSPTQTELIKALHAAQQEFPLIEKTKDGQAGNRKFKYAPLETIKAVCDPILWAHGLMVTQGPDGHLLETRLDHISGEWREISMPMDKEFPSDQSYGIAFSYRRRYSYQGILGIVTEEDIDGNARKRGEKPDDGAKSMRHTPRGGIGDDLPEDWKIYLKDLADDCTALVKSGKALAAYERILEDKLEADQEVFMFNHMDAPTRSAIKSAKPQT